MTVTCPGFILLSPQVMQVPGQTQEVGISRRALLQGGRAPALHLYQAVLLLLNIPVSEVLRQSKSMRASFP